MERKCEEGMERKGKKEKGWWGGGLGGRRFESVRRASIHYAV